MTALLEQPEIGLPGAPGSDLPGGGAQEAPGTYPVPPGRGRWRLTLHRRVFRTTDTWQAGLVVELTGARGRRLEQKWNAPAQLQFTLDGHDPAAELVVELAHDVIAWRWDDTAGADRPMFRGVIGQSEDELTEQKHVVTFTCHDYAAMLGRRFNATPYTATQMDQDTIAQWIVRLGSDLAQSTSGINFAPGNYLPLSAWQTNPDGTWRPNASGTLRDRTYPAQSQLLDLLTNLAAVQGGFDFDVLPLAIQGSAGPGQTDALRIFYPRQGITRTAPVLLYGGTVRSLTRAVNSDSFANYVRVLGNNGSADPAAAQRYSEAWDPGTALGTTVGMWAYSDNAADVSVQSTLDQMAAGDLAYYATLIPSYTLTLTPGAYYYGALNMGDTLPLVIMSGRLKVNTPVRVVGIAYSLDDDTGDEDVELTVGRPVQKLTDLLSATQRDVEALARR